MSLSGQLKYGLGSTVGNGFTVLTYASSSPLTYTLRHTCGGTQCISHAKLMVAVPVCQFCKEAALRSQLSQSPTQIARKAYIKEQDKPAPHTDTQVAPVAPAPEPPVNKHLVSKRAAQMIAGAIASGMDYEIALQQFGNY